MGSNLRTLFIQKCRKTKVESLEIPIQQCGNECDKHDHTEDLHFCFYQTIQPNKFVGDDDHRNVPLTNGKLEPWLNSRSGKHGGPLPEVTVGSIYQ